MVDVVCVGDAALDDYYALPQLPQTDEKILVRYTGRALGGTACNTARALQYLGADVLFLTKTGEDEDGRYIEEAIARLGLAARYLKTERTPRAQILVTPEGDKAILLHGFEDPKKWGAAELAEFYTPVQTQVVYSTLTLPGREALAQFGGALVVSLEAAILEWDARAFQWAAAHAHSIIVDRRAFEIVFGQEASAENLGKAFARLDIAPPCLIVTLGAQGSLAAARGEASVHACPAFPVRAVDTTGAGDIFNAAYIAAYFLKKMPLGEALRYANAIAAASCRVSGAALTASILAEGEKLYRKNAQRDQNYT